MSLPYIFSPSSYSFDSAPITHPCYMVAAISCYLLTIYNLKPRSSTILTRLLQAHNLFSSLMSLLLFVGCLLAVFQRAQQDGVEFIVCEHKQHSAGALSYWSYLFYLSKFYELFDTVFLSLRGKLVGWGGLAVYHHVCVIVMCWFWLHTNMALQYVGLLFNTLVHTLMYYYFYCTSRGLKPTWRKYITLLQIVQFVTSFIMLIPNLYLHFTTINGCQGEWFLFFNCLFNATLLSEFIHIFKAPSKSSSNKNKKNDDDDDDAASLSNTEKPSLSSAADSNDDASSVQQRKHAGKQTSLL